MQGTFRMECAETEWGITEEKIILCNLVIIIAPTLVHKVVLGIGQVMHQLVSVN